MALNSLKDLLSDNKALSVLKLDGVEFKDLRFPNNESYRGGWRDARPEGEGCYTWADGSTYEGAWHAGLKHGWGTYRWPNGAWYCGEWRDGFMQGYGTFESPDGARYVGNWAGNLKHGIGKKTYANGDSYEGLWNHGKAEGPGRYVWHNGNQYDGEWRGGKMHGQGTLKWVTGERYDGEWLDGQESGVGVFTWQDGSTYEGFWHNGRKEGVGVFRPAPHTQGMPGSDPSVRPLSERLSDGASPPHSPVGAASPDWPLDSPAAAGRAVLQLASMPADDRRSIGVGGGSAGGDLVYVCQYESGRLVHEEVLSTSDMDLIFGPVKQAVEKVGRRLRRGRKRQVRMGETIFKGHRSYDLMLNLQLGVRYTITTLNKLPPPALLTEEHFQEKVWLRFPREGSGVTPPHPSGDFKWKDYCPTAFKLLRGLFGIDNSQYILSICGDQALREMPSPGKSGSVFFISHDDRFMIKTMHKEEIKLLLSMLPKYYRHVQANPGTLLTRFYGVHRVKPSHGRKVRFVVMNNVFRTDLDLHRKFDLKGSTYGRTAGPKPGAAAIRKDLDLDVAFRCDHKARARLLAQLAADCSFLEDIHVMDYSLLMGVHCKAFGETSASPLNTDKEDNEAYLSAEEGPRGSTEEAGAEADEEEADEEGSGDEMPGGLQGAGAQRRLSIGAAARGRRIGSAGLAVASTSDSEHDVLHSLHSQPIQHPPTTDSRTSSFVLRGLTWRSFTQRRPSQQLAAPPAMHPGQTQQPPASAQITPRVQPSQLPTPRLLAPGAEPSLLPTMGNGHSQQLPPLQALPGKTAIASALEAAAAAEAEAEAEAAAATVRGSEDQLAGGSQQQQQQQAGAAQQSSAALEPAPAAKAAQQQEQQEEAELTLTSWRSDAVQLPEQLLLPDGLPASPTSSTDTTGATGPTARARGSAAVPALGSIAEQPGSGGSLGIQGGSQQQQQQQQDPQQAAPTGGRQQQAAGEPADQATPGTAPTSSRQQQQQQPAASPPGSARPRQATAAAATAAAAAESPGASCSSSAASTPLAAHSGSRGLALPAGVPRITLQGMPLPKLQPQPDSNDWHQYAETVSDASASLSGSASQRQRGATASPGTEATSPAPRSGGSQTRRRTAPLPGGGGSLELGEAAAAAAAAAAGGSRGFGGSAIASAPVTAREAASAPLSPSGDRAGAASVGAAGGGLHRLAQASGPEASQQGAGAPKLLPAAAFSPPSGGRGLARTASAPAGPVAAAAAAEERRRPQQAQQAQRMLSQVPGREGSVVDLTSPEAVAIHGRLNSRLSRPVTERLVQDLLKLARYRMVGAVVAPSPSARYARMPTTVLAARHMRRATSLIQPQREGRPSADDEPAGPHRISTSSGGAAAAAPPAASSSVAAAAGGEQGAAAAARHLGTGLPAVAVSQQAGQPAEEVLLFFGIIDFLQEYNMRKKLEHSIKAVVQDGKAISVVEPRTYARRFLKFMDKVFPPPQGQQ